MLKPKVFVAGKNSTKVRERLIQKIGDACLYYDAHVIDVGAGDLSFAKELRAIYDGRIDAIDIMLPKDTANELFVKTFEQDLNIRWQLPSNEYDAVFSTSVIEHIENPYLFARELYRITKHDGVVIISTHDRDYYWSKLMWVLRGYHTGFRWPKDGLSFAGHRMPMNEAFLQFVMERAGFEITSSFYGNPNLKLLPLVPAIQRGVPYMKYLCEEVFLVCHKRNTQ